LEARVAELQQQLAESGLSAGERQRRLDELSRAEEQLENLVAEIRRVNPRYAALRYPEPLSLEETRTLLGQDAALLAYSTTREHVVAFLVTADTLLARRLAESPEVIAARVRNYVDVIGEDGDGWREIGRRLYAELVAPVREGIGPRVTRLVVVPDGALHELPFETLPVDAGEGARPRFLLEEFTISYAPSATVLSELAEPGRVFDAPERADAMILADPALDAPGPEPASDRLVRALYEDERLDISPVPATRVEAAAISRFVRPGSAILMGADASERRVKEEGLDRFRVLHFATHGLVSERAPYRSALVLARTDGEDGFLQAREIYGLRLRSDLVVLSACQTARGSVIRGEGVESLAGAFLHAGARSVVASLWNVNDERTATFMEAFYRHLSAGEPSDAALRAAKLELMADPATASPRVWAPFVLVGDGSRPVPIGAPPASGMWTWLAGCALAAALVAFLLRRKSSRGA
jgi:CHAT domain-containing protein